MSKTYPDTSMYQGKSNVIVMNQLTNPANNGFLVLEMMLAFAIFAGLVLTCVSLVFSNQFLVIDGGNHFEAILNSHSGMEDRKSEGFREPGDLNTVWLADYAQAVQSNYEYASNFSNKEVKQESILTKASSLEGRDTCSLYFSGDWKNPKIESQIQLDSNNPATAIEVNDNLLYVSANSSVQSLSDLYVYDVTNTAHPIFKNKLNTGPGLSAIHLAKKFIFAANDGISDQLHIINATNINSLGSTIKIKVPNFNGQASDGKGNSILFYNNRLYLGLTKNNGPELHVYDVQNPQFPFWLGSFETNSAINDIYARDNKIYLAVAEGKLFEALDVTDAGHIFELGSFAPTGNTSQSGQSIFSLGNNIFLGRAGGLPNLGYKELYALNSSYEETANFDLNASIRSLFFRDSFLFLATGQPDNEFQVFNFDGVFKFVSSLDLSSDAVSLDCEEDTIFIATTNGELVIINSEN